MFHKLVYFSIFIGSIYCSGTKGGKPNLPLASEPAIRLERFGNSLYLFAGIYSGTQNQSNAFCNFFNMRLVSIETQEENDFLAYTVPQYFLWSTIDNIWTSGEIFGAGFIWASTGKAVGFMNWGYGEPNDRYGQNNHIRLIYDNDARSLEWELQPNEAIGHTICESVIEVPV